MIRLPDDTKVGVYTSDGTLRESASVDPETGDLDTPLDVEKGETVLVNWPGSVCVLTTEVGTITKLRIE